MSATTSAFAPPRVLPHAAHALGGMWRLAACRFFTPGYWLIVAALLAALIVMSIPAAPTSAADAPEFLSWVAGFYVCFLVPVLAFISGASAMRDDLGAATVDYVFTRPVRRPVYIAFRYLVQMASAQLDFVLGFITVVGIGIFHDVPGLIPALPMLFLAQVFAILVFSAFGFFCGLLTSRYVIVGLIYGAAIEVGVGNVPTQLSQISLIGHLQSLLEPMMSHEGWALARTNATASGTMATLGLLLAVTIALVAFTALLFARRELVASAARDT